MQKNSVDQPLGRLLDGWQPRNPPPQLTLRGNYCSVEPLNIDKHADDLFGVLSAEGSEASWTYLPYGPFANRDEYRTWLQAMPEREPDTQLYIILSQQQKPIGIAGYLRINPTHGVIEIGHLNFSTLLQQTPAATEAMYLMMRHAFDDLGYRRYEWKCNSLNEPSKKAALRFGFQFEGVFRQCNVFKSRNRDTAWFSILDNEWPSIKARFERWLSPENFDSKGKQVKKLTECI